MRYRKLTNDGDMNFGNGQNDFYIDSVDGVVQAVLTGLRLWTGEWFLNTSSGTPYSQAVLGKGKKKTVESAIRKQILSTIGVNSIDEFNYIINEDTRTVQIASKITTDFGQTSVTGIL